MFVVCRYERSDILPAGASIDTDVIVKLGDFGTSTLLNQRKPALITLSNFTTFENTPPEYIYGGDAVEQVCVDAPCTLQAFYRVCNGFTVLFAGILSRCMVSRTVYATHANRLLPL